MVAPLIIGAARIATKQSVKSAGARSAGSKGKELTNIAKNRAIRKTDRRLQSVQTDENHTNQKPANRNYRPAPPQKKKRGVARTLKAHKRILRAKIRGIMIAWSAAFFFIPQVFFGLLFVGSIGLEEEWGWLSYFLPTREVMSLGWLGASATGILMLTLALIAFAAARVKLHHTSTVAMFTVCLAAYMTPFLFLFPWVLVWVFVVIKNQSR